jgi:hypothetical protein
MSAILVDVGKLSNLSSLIGNQFPSAKAFLYANNYTPVHGSVFSNFTECSFTGYARQTVAGWSAPVLDASFNASSTAGAVTFTNSGGSSTNVYGWGLLLSPAFTTLLVAELFAGAPLVVGAGQSLILTPTYLVTSLF